MAKGYGSYQYGTSPRKVEPEYRPKNRKPKNQKVKSKKENKQPKNTKKQNNVKVNKKVKAKTVLYIAIAFSLLLVISYRNSQITEQFTEVKNLKAELTKLEKSNEQIEANIESNINLSKIEKEAQEQLGMQKIDNGQKVYVSLPKKDYIEPATENVKSNNNTNWFINFINNLLGK